MKKRAKNSIIRKNCSATGVKKELPEIIAEKRKKIIYAPILLGWAPTLMIRKKKSNHQK